MDETEEKITKDKKSFAKAGKRSVKATEEKTALLAKEAKKADSKSQAPKIVPKKNRTKLEKRSKKYRQIAELVDKSKTYELDEAITLIKKLNPTKFNATIELHIALNVDPKHADQNIRDNLVLPFGNGKILKVGVFSDDEESAKQAGADFYGLDTIINMIEKNNLEFDILITTPNQMAKLAKFAKILGPKGLMPNPKSGTVATDLSRAITEVKKGKIEYRVDSYGIVHLPLAKVDFPENQIQENLLAVMTSIKNNKPQSVKSNYIKSVYLTTTMGPAIKLNFNSF